LRVTRQTWKKLLGRGGKGKNPAEGAQVTTDGAGSWTIEKKENKVNGGKKNYKVGVWREGGLSGLTKRKLRIKEVGNRGRDLSAC